MLLLCCTNTGLQSPETMEEPEVLAVFESFFCPAGCFGSSVCNTPIPFHSIVDSLMSWKGNSLKVLHFKKNVVWSPSLSHEQRGFPSSHRIYFSVMYPLLICLNTCTILQSAFMMKWALNWSLGVVVLIPVPSTVQSDGPGHVDSAFDSATSHLQDGVINSTCFKGSARWWRGTCEQYVSHCDQGRVTFHTITLCKTFAATILLSSRPPLRFGVVCNAYLFIMY